MVNRMSQVSFSALREKSFDSGLLMVLKRLVLRSSEAAAGYDSVSRFCSSKAVCGRFSQSTERHDSTMSYRSSENFWRAIWRIGIILSFSSRWSPACGGVPEMQVYIVAPTE